MKFDNQSASRLAIQDRKSAARLGRWVSGLPRDCAKVTVWRGMGPGVLLVVAPRLATHGA